MGERATTCLACRCVEGDAPWHTHTYRHTHARDLYAAEITSSTRPTHFGCLPAPSTPHTDAATQRTRFLLFFLCRCCILEATFALIILACPGAAKARPARRPRPRQLIAVVGTAATRTFTRGPLHCLSPEPLSPRFKFPGTLSASEACLLSFSHRHCDSTKVEVFKSAWKKASDTTHVSVLTEV